MERLVPSDETAGVPNPGCDSPQAPRFPFELLSLLGSGGQGGVFRARCMEPCGMDGVVPGDVVALKIIPVPAKEAGRLLSRLKIRTRAIGRLRSPAIVRHFGCLAAAAGPTGVVLVSVMELAEGRLLSDILRGAPAGMGPAAALDLARRLVGAFAEMESAGIAHCDVQPGNIVFAVGGAPLLIDFGLAAIPRARRPLSGPAPSGGRLAAVRGAFDFMAPDFVRPFRPHPRFCGDSLSDLFSFCVLVHMAAVGRLPYASPLRKRAGYERRWFNPATAAAAIRVDEAAFAPVPGLADVLRRGLVPDRAVRTPSFRALEAELNALCRPS